MALDKQLSLSEVTSYREVTKGRLVQMQKVGGLVMGEEAPGED